jgi:hypothetical protein
MNDGEKCFCCTSWKAEDIRRTNVSMKCLRMGEREGGRKWKVAGKGGKRFWRWRGRCQVTDGMFKEGRWRREKYRF